MLGVADCIIRRVIPQPTEWQHVADQIKAATIFAWMNFVKCATRLLASSLG
jgi:hypothetical protein